jgi:hypothetical protein
LVGAEYPATVSGWEIDIKGSVERGRVCDVDLLRSLNSRELGQPKAEQLVTLPSVVRSPVS